MKLGIFGGTFDPVHFGHLLLAETCRVKLELDAVRFIPAGNPPHKTDGEISDGHARADMLELAVSGYPEFQIDRREIRREGPSFTVDTLGELSAELPEAELYFLMGADSLRDIPAWREPQKIASLARLVAVNRPGVELPSAATIQTWAGDLASNVTVLPMPGTDLAATELRQRVVRGEGLRFMTPRAVEAYIDQHGIYVAG